MKISANPRIALSGARRSCETLYENDSRVAIGRGQLDIRPLQHDSLRALAPLQLGILQAQAPQLERTLNHRQDYVELEGFQDVVIGANLHGGNGSVDRAVAGHHDSGQLRVDLARRLQQLDAVELGHHEIGQQQVVGAAAQ